jgi:phage tail sheath protein FI
MPSYQTPGVYIREVSGVKSIEAVGTSVTAFIGFTSKRPADSRPGEPRKITSWNKYVEEFGDFVEGFYLPLSVYGYFQNGGGICYVLSLMTAEERAFRSASTGQGKPSTLLQGLGLIAESRGGDAVRVTVERATEKPADRPSEGDDAAPKEPARDSWRVVVHPVSGSDETYTFVPRADKNTVIQEINRKSKLVTVRDVNPSDTSALREPTFGTYAMTVPQSAPATSTALLTSKDFEGDVLATPRTGLAGLQETEDVTIVAMPDIMTMAPDDVAAFQKLLVAHCEQMKDRLAILDAPRGLSAQQVEQWTKNALNVQSSYAALYYPWITVKNPLANGKGEKYIQVPPSGHIAGVYARIDGERGVHKAPANEVIQGAMDVERRIINTDQDSLNPIGVNCIRNFPGRGIRIWGARTLAGGDSEWRYINVRRLFCMLEESIFEGTQWAVFEPNDYDLWARVKRDISAFLKRQWLQGAFFGATPEEAYYVKCDAENNPPETREIGELYIEVGVAPVKPAEFIVISFKQISGIAQ